MQKTATAQPGSQEQRAELTEGRRRPCTITLSISVVTAVTAGLRPTLTDLRVLPVEFQYLLQRALLVGQVLVGSEVLPVQGFVVITYFR